MKKAFCLVVSLFFVSAVAFAADPAPVAAVGFLDWFKQNSGAVLGFALALSEILSLIPAFKGNGILDTIIKALQAMSGNPPTPPAA